MKRDMEYMLTKATGTEDVLFSANTLKAVAKFCKIPYNSAKSYSCKGSTFYFENRLVRIEPIDMNAVYEIEASCPYKMEPAE